MNKIKILFLTVLCLGLVGGVIKVAAQTDNKVLVSKGGATLKQTDVETMIEFYEFVFDAKFSDAQKMDFADNTKREFEKDPKGNRAAIDDIAKIMPKVLAASGEVRQNFKKEFLNEFLPEARKNADLNSRLLLEVYESGQSGNDDSILANNSNDSENDSAVSNVGNISALTGKWIWSRSGSSTYAAGGAYLGSNGSRFTYQFSPNGAVEYTGIMNVMTGGCTMQVFKSVKGKASLNGNTLTINWSPASFSRDDSCDRAGNYKKTLPAETETFKIGFKTDYGQRQLCLTGKDETCFSPEN